MRIGRRRIRHKDVFSPDITLADYDETDPEVPVVDRLPKRSLDGTFVLISCANICHSCV